MSTGTKSFEQWMNQVNFWVRREAGLSADDLHDCCYRDWYEDGVKPRTAAKRALKAANDE